jgi:hypothetical protein
MYAPESLNDESFENSELYSLGYVDNYLDKSGLNTQINKYVYSDRIQEVENCDYHGIIMYGGERYSFHSFLGLTSFSGITIDNDHIGYYLVGAIIDGVSWGDLTHTEITSGNNNYTNTFLIKPNPVDDDITIPFNEGNYLIFNLNGQLVQQGKCTTSNISVMELGLGFYTVVVMANGTNYRAVFVKK